MNLELRRTDFGPKATIGELLIDGVFECYTLEDVVREGDKVYGSTAIPFGRYPVLIDFSQRFQRRMPHIASVPGFDGIRIHWGNTDKDTLGCPLVGATKVSADFIGHSREAFEKFFPKLELALTHGSVFIDVTDGRKQAV